MPVKNEVVPSRFDWGIVAASCIASLCGCGLAVELLHRRGTGVRSKRSWAETITCAVCLGLIGIWCMHFIGNRAIILGDGSDSLQLVYNAGFSVLSAFLPIIVLIIAFAIAEQQYRSRSHRWIALIVTGVCSGFSVVGMHYIGNLGISNYELHYPPGFFAASFAIAIVDCLTVMVLFYTWREKWISHWPRRMACAVVLAVGISSMHFVASTNCVYHFKHYGKPNAVRSRNTQVIVAGILCGAAGVAVGLFLVYSRFQGRLRKKRSSKVMLNCAMFAPDGRLLVTTEGTLPAREITDKYHHRTFTEEFNTTHTVFQWIFRVTRNWSSVNDFIPKMKSHISALRGDGAEDTRPNSSDSNTKYDSDTYKDYSVIFRERFCVAAANLAASMNLPLTLMGVLFDRIIDTGTLSLEDGTSDNTLRAGSQDGDLEMARSPEIYGTGQLLILTRQLDHDDVNKLINSGFKFATVEQVGRTIATTMQIPLSTLEGHVADLRRYVDDKSALKKGGTWLSCFVMRSRLHGFDIAVKKTQQDELPDAQILPEEPVQWQAEFLNSMHKKTFQVCAVFLQSVVNSTYEYTNREQNFADILLRAFVIIADQVPDLWLKKAVFYGNPLQAHFSESLGYDAPITHLYAFVTITDVNASFPGRTLITPVPVEFFQVRRQCYAGSPNHAVFAHGVHQEFSTLLARKTERNEDKVKKLSSYVLSLPPNRKNKTSTAGSHIPQAILSSAADDNENSMEMSELVDPMEMILQSSRALQAITHGPEERDNAHDGIQVIDDSRLPAASPTGNDQNDRNNLFDNRSGAMRTVADVAAALPEKTFVDELIAFAKIITKPTNQI